MLIYDNISMIVIGARSASSLGLGYRLGRMHEIEAINGTFKPPREAGIGTE